MGARIRTRRVGIRFRALMAMLLGTMLVASCMIFPAAAVPAAARGAMPGLGFTLHTLYLGALKRFDLTTFEANVDELAAEHAQWVRVDLWPDIVAPSGTARAIHWDSASLARYDQALAYVKRKGLRVYLDTGVPNYTKQYTEADYLAVARTFYAAIAARYHAVVDMWQIANEPNRSNFRDPSQIVKRPYSMDYVEAFNRLLALARGQIQAISPSSAIVINLALSNTAPRSVEPFLAVTAPNVDVIGIDSYPGTRMDWLESAVSQMKAIKQRYHRPIMVVETGICSSTYGSTGQRTYIPLYVSRFLSARPLAILIYQFQDTPQGPSVSACERTYGIEDTAGKGKPSYTSIFTNLQRILDLAHPHSPFVPPGFLTQSRASEVRGQSW